MNFFKERKKIFLLSFFIMIDFILTYIGINILQFIEEANPFLINLFEVNLFIAVILRTLHITLIFLCLDYIRTKKEKLYNNIVNFSLILNVAVFALHIRWLALYLQG